MLFLLLINFYTSRIVLKELGVDDFGIYNVVGSVIIMFTSLRMLIASSTQRFLNFEMGKGNFEKLNSVYNMSLYINTIISIFFFIIVELVGLWFLYNKINIDSTRFNAAMIVFQCSVIGSIFSIFSTTYDAEIIAHERMGFFAYISIFDAILKLGAVFILALVPFDKLIFYGFLLMIISFLSLSFNIIYSIAHFDECKIKKKWDKVLFKDMLLFASWNFIGKSSYAITQSGLNLILNVFGGPTVNAARGIAFQLNSATNQFVNNVNIVLDPFFIKTYAEGDIQKFYTIFNFSSKALYFVQLCLVIPFYILSELILMIWLGQVPEFSVVFLRLILIWSLIRAPHSPIDKLFKAVGDIKYYQILEGIILALPILFSYVCLKMGLSYNTVFWSMIIFEFFNLVTIVTLAVKICGLSINAYLKYVFSPCFFMSVPFLFSLLFDLNSVNTIYKLIFTVIVELATLVLFYFCLQKNERLHLKYILKGNRK